MKVQLCEGQQDITESDLGDLQKKLAEATLRLTEAARDESIARSRSTDARNAVNAIQKKIDGVLTGLRQCAPSDTNWSRSEQKSV